MIDEKSDSSENSISAKIISDVTAFTTLIPIIGTTL